jgi:O-antigen ligase
MPTRLDRAAHALLALYVVAVLAAPKIPTTLAGLTCIVALVSAYGSWRRQAREALPFMAVLVVPAAAYLLHLLVQIVVGMAPFKMSSQVLVGTLALAVGLSAVPGRPADVRRLLLPAAAVGAIAACALAAWQVWGLGYERPYGWLGGGPIGNSAIKFADLAVVQGLLSLVLILRAAQAWRRILGFAGLFCATFALALTQARGGVLGLLLSAAVLGLVLALRHRARAAANSAAVAAPLGETPALHGARRGTTVVMVAVAIVLTLSAAGFMQDRFAEIEPQVERYLDGDIEGSEIGQRLALWQAALRAGMHQPVTGVGFGGFGEELDRQRASGEIPASMDILYRQTHSEYLAAFAQAGVTGFLSLLLMFVAPVFALARRIVAGDDSAAACAALVTATAFAGFALTDNMFDRQVTVIAFYLLNAWFLRAALPARTTAGGFAASRS